MACSAIATNCPAIVASWSRLAYCRIVACCTGTVAALIESPRSPDSSSATGHSFWWWVAVGRKIARRRSRPFRSARTSRFVPRSTANARPRHQNNLDLVPFPVLPRLSQLRTFFGFFAMSFMVKACVFIVGVWRNGRVETKYLPFDIGHLAICSWHVSAQQQSQERRQRSSLLQHRRKPSPGFGQDGAANRCLSGRDQRRTASGLAQDADGVR